VYMSRTTVLSPAALTIGQKVSLFTSVTCPTVTVGPAVSKLDLTLKFLLKLKLVVLVLKLRFTLGMFMLPKPDPSEGLKEEPLSMEGDATHLGLGETQTFRAIGACWEFQWQRGKNSSHI